MASTYEPIATTTVSVATSSITFSSIPSTYTDLRIVMSNVTVSAGGNISLKFSATNGIYSQTNLYGNGSAVTSDRISNFDYFTTTQGLAPSLTVPSFYTFDVFSYAGSTNKTCLMTSSQDRNGSGDIEQNVGLWRNTAAISSIILSITSGTLLVGTSATIYGIKAA
jgi:hypothetical protein